MKLLLDQNLSRYLVKELSGRFPGTAHVSDFKLESADDETIWRFAAREGFTLMSKDSDFFHRSLLRGHPPKVIQIRAGNCSTSQMASLLALNSQRILEFGAEPAESLLIL